MTARAAAGMSSSAVKAPLIAPSVASHSFDRPLALPLIRAANLGSPGASRLQCLAPSALYRPSNSPTRLNSALSRSSGFPQLGISVWQESARQQRMCVVARGMAAGAGSDLESWINETISKEPVVVYSKTYCPYVFLYRLPNFDVQQIACFHPIFLILWFANPCTGRSRLRSIADGSCVSAGIACA